MDFEPTPWTPDHDRVSGLCKAGQEREEAGERAEAARLYREAIAVDPRHARARLLLGSLLGESPATRRAGIRAIREALELEPDDPHALVALGSLLMHDSRCAEAERVLERALTLAPRAGTCVFLAVCAETLGQREEAAARYRQALDLDPAYEEALCNLACLVRFSDPVAAERHLRTAIEIDPVYARAWGELGHVLLLQDRAVEAIDALERSVELLGSLHWHRLRLSVALLQLGREREADQHLKHALRRRHTLTTREHVECLASSLAAERPEPWARLYRAYLLGRRLDFCEALRLLDGAPDDSPLASLRQALLADQAVWKILDGKCPDVAERIRLLELAVEREPTHPEAWEELGKARYSLAAHIAAGQQSHDSVETVLGWAQEALDRAISLEPDRPYAHLYLGLAQKLARKHEAAEAAMRRAVELGSEGVHAAVLGDHLADLGRFQEAEAVFEQALADYPECAMAWRDYGRTLIRDMHPAGGGNLPRAAEAFERAVALAPENAENHFRLADALSCIHTDFLPRAREHLLRCLELRPDHPRARQVLAAVERLLEESKS